MHLQFANSGGTVTKRSNERTLPGRRQRSFEIAKRLALWIGASATAGIVRVEAQSLTYDAARRLYTLTYRDDAGQQRSVSIEPPNRIEPRIALVLSAVGGLPRYAYTVENQAGPLTTQSIDAFEFPCEGLASLPRPAAPAGWFARTQMTERIRRRVCTFTASEAAAVISSGNRRGTFGVISDMQPGIVDAAFWGKGLPAPVLPGLELTEPEIALLVDRAIGATGGFFAAKLVAPVRTIASLVTNLAVGVGMIRDDLSQACTLQWVTVEACASLGDLLRQSLGHLGSANPPAAKAALSTFLQHIDTERTRSGVNDQAYALLSSNARLISSRM
jgi:hypothetical protein